jgi:small subunit ribosomal protein S20
MPIIKSAKKRVRVTRKATVRNSKTKRSIKGAIKAFHSAVSSGKNVKEAHSSAQSAIDKATKKNLVHKNKAARQQRQLAAKAKAAATAALAKKATAKKTVAKKAAPKKTAAKKPTAKKK